MNHRIIAAALALALALPAFAQENTSQPQQNPQGADQDSPADSAAGAPQAPPSDATDTASADTSPPATTSPHRHHRRPPPPPADNVGGADSTPSNNPAYNANTARLTGNEPKVVAYQYSNRLKHYPAVDRGHVPGDPPVINHDDDQAPVPNPTTNRIIIPPSPN